jgi:hypothetical protein
MAASSESAGGRGGKSIKNLSAFAIATENLTDLSEGVFVCVRLFEGAVSADLPLNLGEPVVG